MSLFYPEVHDSKPEGVGSFENHKGQFVQITDSKGFVNVDPLTLILGTTVSIYRDVPEPAITAMSNYDGAEQMNEIFNG